MSKFKTRHLNNSVKQGFIDDKHRAWHFAGIPTQTLIDEGKAYAGAVPLEVAERLLSYTPQLRKVYVEDDDGFPVLVEDRRAVVLPFDADPDAGADTVTKRVAYIGTDQYAIHDPKLAVLDAVIALADAGCDLASVGKLGGGRMAFSSWRPIEGRIEIPGFTLLETYINAGTSTDGSLATSYSPSTTMRVCDNTARWSDRQAERSGRYYSVKHTTNSVLDINRAREVIEVAVTRTNDVAANMERMANVTLSEADFYALTNKLYPLPEGEGRSRTMQLNKIGEINRLYFTDGRVPTSVRGTLLGAWQAFNTQATWGYEVRGNKIDPIGRQWERTIRGNGAQVTVRDGKKTAQVDLDAQFWAMVGALDLAPALVKVNA